MGCRTRWKQTFRHQSGYGTSNAGDVAGSVERRPRFEKTGPADRLGHGLTPVPPTVVVHIHEPAVPVDRLEVDPVKSGKGGMLAGAARFSQGCGINVVDAERASDFRQRNGGVLDRTVAMGAADFRRLGLLVMTRPTRRVTSLA